MIFILSVSANNGNMNNVKMRSVVNPGLQKHSCHFNHENKNHGVHKFSVGDEPF
jgi:hypothetical protein